MKMTSFAVAALLCSSVALAQPGPMMGGPGGQMMGGGYGPMMGIGGGHCAMMGRSEGALAFLKTELKVSSGQEKPWNAFAAAYREEAAKKPAGPKAGARGAMRGQGPRMMGFGGGPFPEAAAQHLQFMEQHIASAKRLTDAAKPLYDALNADQKKSADELLLHFVMMRCPMWAGDQ